MANVLTTLSVHLNVGEMVGSTLCVFYHNLKYSKPRTHCSPLWGTAPRTGGLGFSWWSLG